MPIKEKPDTAKAGLIAIGIALFVAGIIFGRWSVATERIETEKIVEREVGNPFKFSESSSWVRLANLRGEQHSPADRIQQLLAFLSERPENDATKEATKELSFLRSKHPSDFLEAVLGGHFYRMEEGSPVFGESGFSTISQAQVAGTAFHSAYIVKDPTERIQQVGAVAAQYSGTLISRVAELAIAKANAEIEYSKKLR